MSYLDTSDLDEELDELQERADNPECNCRPCAVCKSEDPVVCGKCGMCTRCHDHAPGCEGCDSCVDLEPLDDDERERLAALVALRDYIGSEWEDGVTLIPEYEFADYAREMAESCGMVDRDSQMSNYIDWERWANDVQMDYTSVEFDGETYYYRA